MTDDTTPRTTDGQDDEQPDSAVLDATVPLETTDPTADRDDLAPVGDALADARVVGLGEATHGSREFFQLKHRILRHLVVEHGVRHFAMEANLPEAEAIDDYVVHGEGDPEAALEGVYFWTWQVDAVLAMVEWLREFNEGRPPEDRVRFHGFDAQYSHGAVERFREHLERVDPDFLAAVESDLDAADDEGNPPHQADDVPERVAATERVVPRLREHLDERQVAHVEAAGEAGAERLRRYLAVMEQAADYADTTDDMDGDLVGGDDYDADSMERLMRTRDRAMADNVDWLLDRVDGEPLVLWAHDAHLNRGEQVHRDTGASATALGGHLADAHGEDYRAVGFSFARGAFQAVSEDAAGNYGLREQRLDGPLAGTFDAALAELGEPLAFVDLRDAAEDDATADWLAEPRPHFSAGSTYDDEDPTDYLTEYAYGEAFDAVCFVEETTRALPLEEDDD